jgi:nitrite reductase/ring-hydroxylating ferredoxin subunit
MSLTDGAVLTCGWRKASYSINNGQCVEVASASRVTVLVRDSIDPAGPVVTFSGQAWQAFLAGAKSNGIGTIRIS